jgi:replicative DNA helicase
MRLGMVARIGTLHQRGYRPVYSVDVSGADQQHRFLERVGAFGPRCAPAARLSAILDSRETNTNVDALPIEVFEEVKAAMRAQGVSQRAMASMRGTSYGGSGHFGFAPSRGVMASYATVLDDDRLRVWAEDDLFWDGSARQPARSRKCSI